MRTGSHDFMEAEQSHHLPSAGWRTRKASGVLQSKSEGLGPGALSGGGEDGCPAQAEGTDLPFLHLFALFRLSRTGGHPHALVSLLLQMLISSRDTLTGTPRNTALPPIWASVSPSSGHTQLTLTFPLI